MSNGEREDDDVAADESESVTMLEIDSDTKDTLLDVSVIPDKNKGSVLWFPHAGIFLAFLFCLFVSIAMVLLKLLKQYSAPFITLVRCLILMGLLSPFMLYLRIHIFPKGSRKFLIIRAFSVGIGMIARTISVSKLPLGDALAIIYIHPVIVLLLARMFLKEACGLFHAVVCSVSLCGVVLVVQPSFIFGHDIIEALDPVGIAWSLVSAVCCAVFIISTRKLKEVSKLLLVYHAALSGIIASVGPVLILQEYEWFSSYIDWLYIMGVVVCVGIAQFTISKALQYENANIVTVVRVSEVLFSFIWQIVIFKEIPTVLSLSGSLLICLSAAAIGLYSFIKNLPETNKVKGVLHKWFGKTFI